MLGQIIFIAAITLLVWHKILFQVPVGEGYYYFSQLQHVWPIGRIYRISQLFLYDYFARLINQALIPILGDNLTAYMAFQLLVMILLYISFFLVISKLTKNRTLALLTTIFLIANYVGSFSMLGTGNYQWFLQRIPNLIILLGSFYFLFRYFAENKKRYLFFSYFGFFLSIFLAQHSVFFAVLFITYPSAQWLTANKKSVKKFLKAILISAGYAIIAYLVTSQAKLKPSKGILEFVQENNRLLEMIVYQIPIQLIPNNIILFLAELWPSILFQPFLPVLRLTLLPLLIILSWTAFRLRKDKKIIITLYLTSLLSILILAFLNLYAYDTQPNPLKHFGEDRVYFIPSFFVAIIWASIIKAVFLKRKLMFKIFSTLVAFLFLYSNINLIWSHMDQVHYQTVAIRSFILYCKEISPKFSESTVIAAPSSILWPANFIITFYGHPKMKFVTFDENWKETLTPYKKENVFVFDYDYRYINTKSPSHARQGRMIDLTDKFRSGATLNPK